MPQRQRCSAGSWFHKWEGPVGKRVCVNCKKTHWRDIPEDVRFWSKVDIKGPDECWLWKRALQTQGYGHLGFRGRTSRAHAVAYFLHHGSIPGGLWSATCVIMHTCDVKRCVNPRHLIAATQKENLEDCYMKGRNSNAKLTVDQVREILHLHQHGHASRELAQKFNVKICTIQGVVSGRTWGFVKSPSRHKEQR